MPTGEQFPWKNIDFKAQPEAYLRALLAYGIKVNGTDAIDWRIEDNTSEHWCHAPWFHNARERIHGMTPERGSRLKELHRLQLSRASNWAVGFYNSIGCYALGSVWNDPAFPKTKGMHFPDGSYSIKLLFTTASPSQVPYLTGSKIWNAAIGNDGSSVPMRLLQVDVAVRDTAADDFTGWLFGTFIYDASTAGGTVWERLVPVGLMWGNDPQLTTRSYEEQGKDPIEGWYNPVVAERFYPLPRHNLGLHGRVNGPVDNSKSACLACHSRALDWGRAVLRNSPQQEEAEVLLPLAPNPYDDAAVRHYFRNLKSDQPFVAGTQSLDYSLQLAIGITNFRSWVQTNHPDQSSSTTDVPPYRFKADDQNFDLLSSLYFQGLRNAAGALSARETYAPFARGEE